MGRKKCARLGLWARHKGVEMVIFSRKNGIAQQWLQIENGIHKSICLAQFGDLFGYFPSLSFIHRVVVNAPPDKTLNDRHCVCVCRMVCIVFKSRSHQKCIGCEVRYQKHINYEMSKQTSERVRCALTF